MHILVTGAAGFIGYHLSKTLCEQGHTVIGIDNLNEYYDSDLKRARLEQLKPDNRFTFQKLDLVDRQGVNALFASQKFDTVMNLAAQAGVRYSLENPHAYIDSNIVGFTHILECCRHNQIKHLIYASTSSVYGANSAYPFVEDQPADHPLALYAATKRANELMAHSYSHLYRLPTTGLRFFTVYGPWGRPDMALFQFTKNMLEDQPINVYNEGNMQRDFTYVDDIVTGIISAIGHPAKPDPNWNSNSPTPHTSNAPWRVYNIGNGNPVNLMDFITALEKYLGKTAKKNFMPMQAGDVPATFADTTALETDLAFTPKTSINDGIKAFVDWYLKHYSE